MDIKELIKNAYPGAKVFEDYDGVKFTKPGCLKDRIYLAIDYPNAIKIYDSVGGVLVETIPKKQ